MNDFSKNDFYKEADSVDSLADLLVFIDHLRGSLSKNDPCGENGNEKESYSCCLGKGTFGMGTDWYNTDLSSFLEAMAAWINDIKKVSRQPDSQNDRLLEKPSWKTFAVFLLMGCDYE